MERDNPTKGAQLKNVEDCAGKMALRTAVPEDELPEECREFRDKLPFDDNGYSLLYPQEFLDSVPISDHEQQRTSDLTTSAGFAVLAGGVILGVVLHEQNTREHTLHDSHQPISST